VRYIVEGSVQRSGDQIRVNVQLIDAVDGHHLWADNFDGKTEDLFALQDDIVRRITIELQVKLTFGDFVRGAARGTTNLDAWLLQIQANTQGYKFTREGTARSRELYQQAHEADPNWARPLAGIAWCYFLEARQGWTDDREGWIRKGIEFAEKAIEMDPKQPGGYMQVGNFMQLQGDHDRAIAFREKAVELAPNDMATNWGLGVALYKAGQAERGLAFLKGTERLAPRHPVPLLWSIQEAQFLASQYEQSIEAGKRAIARNEEPTFPHVLLVAAYGALGRTEKSQAEAATILKSDPGFTVTKFMRTRSYKNQSDLDRLSGSLIKAGLPE
jgi:tetratricopeptide (TPR) repeat protein